MSILKFLFLVLEDDALEFSRLSLYSKSDSMYFIASTAFASCSSVSIKCRRWCTNGSARGGRGWQIWSYLNVATRDYLWGYACPCSLSLPVGTCRRRCKGVSLQECRSNSSIKQLLISILTSAYSIQAIILFRVHAGQLFQSILAHF